MAMKRFIIKSVVFILLLYLADAAIGTALKNVARMAKGVSGRTAYIHDWGSNVSTAGRTKWG